MGKRKASLKGKKSPPSSSIRIRTIRKFKWTSLVERPTDRLVDVRSKLGKVLGQVPHYRELYFHSQYYQFLAAKLHVQNVFGLPARNVDFFDEIGDDETFRQYIVVNDVESSNETLWSQTMNCS